MLLLCSLHLSAEDHLSGYSPTFSGWVVLKIKASELILIFFKICLKNKVRSAGQKRPLALRGQADRSRKIAFMGSPGVAMQQSKAVLEVILVLQNHICTLHSYAWPVTSMFFSFSCWACTVLTSSAGFTQKLTGEGQPCIQARGSWKQASTVLGYWSLLYSETWSRISANCPGQRLGLHYVSHVLSFIHNSLGRDSFKNKLDSKSYSEAFWVVLTFEICNGLWEGLVFDAWLLGTHPWMYTSVCSSYGNTNKSHCFCSVGDNDA